MPAITLAWPEARYFGYDRVLAAADLGYRGQPFNWVTMPDQFTLAAFERQVLDPAPRPPVFAEIALISSHAPWTPIPPLLPWDALGRRRGLRPLRRGRRPAGGGLARRRTGCASSTAARSTTSCASSASFAERRAARRRR